MGAGNVFLGFAGLAVIIGAWLAWSGKGVPWQQSQQQQQQNQQRRQQGGQGGQGRQGGQGGTQSNEHHEEGEGDPADWSEEELKAWLEHRGEEVDENTETRVMLLSRVQDMRR